MTTAIAYPLYREQREFDWLVTLLVLQGLANRAGPRLYFDARQLTDWQQADRLRRKDNERRYGIRCRDVRSRERLLGELADAFDGVVLYDARLDAARWIAVTVAALENRLPMTVRQVRSLRRKPSIAVDLRGRWDNAQAAYRWAARELLPGCHRSLAYNAGHSHAGVDMGQDPGVITALDYAVMQRGFAFNLSPAAKPTTYFKRRIPGYPDDVAILRRILRALDAPAAVYGWAEPEWDFATLLSRHNHYLMCGRAANLSFHAAINAKARRFKQTRSRRRVVLGQKCYVAFMTSEGDTARVTSSYFMGGWQDPARGRVSVNWGVNPIETATMPAHIAPYYDTATDNDCFFAGVGGAGYVFLNRVPNVALFAEHAAPHLRRADIDIVELWHNGPIRRDTYDVFAKRCRLQGIVHLAKGKAFIERPGSGVPIVYMDKSLVHPEGGVPVIVRRIRRVVAERGLPLFLLVYRSPRPRVVSEFRQIARELGDEQFAFVRLDEMMRLVRQVDS